MACTYYCYKSGLFSGDYWCNKKDERVDEGTYYQYCRNYDYTNCPIYKQTEVSGCFITTVACQILGKEDHDPILDDFRNFRDNVLQKNEKYYEILKEYDIIGPKLAKCIFYDKDKTKIASGIYNTVLTKIHHLVSQKKYDEAVEKYYVMTLMLINYYSLKHEYNQIKETKFDDFLFIPNQSGHGRIKKRQ